MLEKNTETLQPIECTAEEYKAVKLVVDCVNESRRARGIDRRCKFRDAYHALRTDGFDELYELFEQIDYFFFHDS